ncbi:hypothetical protein B9G69_016150 [Bdellovibrio sp. SKB1291214]|uniref:hypothetical protein n=1 Tax=Bdellovibrio sp. SKB1291214 TaxID=1732569 RepID=UPI0022405F3F|nr:hypothetical protein [Bdellovibrio sp. SKB1291214]UYL08577.1 hypothetical protein B9G69_016150 [Bdellovibrio sp. SKB1291214]
MKFTSTVLIAATVLTCNIANAGITCSSTECKAEDMPLLNQMESSVKAKFGSMACLPTSSTMVMESIFNVKKDIVAGSFTESLYQQGVYGAVVMLGADICRHASRTIGFDSFRILHSKMFRDGERSQDLQLHSSVWALSRCPSSFCFINTNL